MFSKTKIALTAALVLGSASGAFAGGYNNVGEIEQPAAPSMHRHMTGHAFASFAMAPRRATTSVAVQNAWFDRPTRYISSY